MRKEMIILDDEPGATSAKRRRDPILITLDDDPPPAPKLSRYSESSFPSSEAELSYYKWCVHTLSVEFPRASMGSVRRALRSHGKKLTPAYEAMHEAYQSALKREKASASATEPLEIEENEAAESQGMELSRFNRRVTDRPSWEPCMRFEEEFAAIKKKYPQLPETPSQEAVKDIECGCCYTDCSFDELAQCADGHLFCFHCLKRHVEESAFGGGKSQSSLPCMDTSGCTESFPWSEVQRAVPRDVLAKYEKTLAEDAVARAKIEGMVYCPFCEVACEVDKGLEVLPCPNPACRKSSCLKCREPDHFPQKCQKDEAETFLRTQVEELMTKALIRQCVACKAELIKADGCNKIICKCGKMMCYVCRKQITGYEHFCTHTPRRENCRACVNKCSLWEKDNSDDLVKNARKAAMQEASLQDPEILNQTIGPDDERLKASAKPTVARHPPAIRGRGRGRRAGPGL